MKITTITTAEAATTGQDAEELLQRILYSDLACLVDPPFLPRSAAADVAMTDGNESLSASPSPSPTTSKAASYIGDDDDHDAVSEMIWQYLVCSADDPMDAGVDDDEEEEEEGMTTAATTTTLDELWKKGWKQIGSILSSNLLSPFCIHDTATQALFLKESGDLDEENNIYVNSKTGVLPCRLFTTTCFLVCCAALQRCPTPSPPPDAATTTHAPPPLPRKRRWRSCMMNTVRLIQQQWLQQQHQQQQQQQQHYGNNHDKKNLAVIVSIFVHYIVPTCFQVQQTLFHDDNNINIRKNDAWFWQAAIHAGLIATISSMAAAAVTNWTLHDEDDTDNKLLALLVQTLDRIMTGGGDGGNVHAVWKHPWRKWHRLGPQELLRADESTTSVNHNNSHNEQKASTIQSLSYEDSLCYWTAPVLASDDEEEEAENWDDDDAMDDEQPESREHHRSESVARMNTIWNNVGIAVLANYNLSIDEQRPLVYTKQYIWQVGFPHVAILLLTTEEDVNDNEIKDIHSRQYLACQQDKQQMLGYKLLEWLLSRMPENELSKPITTVPEQPHSPIPVFQLLSNRIINTGRGVATTTASTAVLPSGYQAYQLMKLLLSKYKLAHQLDLVRKLYTDCPHAGLGPKILDLLRGLLLTLVKSNIEVVASPNDLLASVPATRLALWDYLDTLLRDLDGHVECMNHEIMGIKTTTKTNQDDKSSSNSQSSLLFLIDNVQEFVADAEKFVSVLTLIRTWMLVKNNTNTDNTNNNIPPDIPQLATRLETAHKALELMFEHAAENDANSVATTTTAATTIVRPPEQQLFRLQLLMQALEESIQLLKNSSS